MIITLYSTDVTMLEVGTGIKNDTTVLQTQTVELTPGKSAPILKEEVKQRITTAMADTYSRQILKAAIERPISAAELTKQYDIPATTVYRRIEELIEAGLIASISSGRTKEGKWFDVYRSLIKRIEISFEGELRVDVTVNEDVAYRFWRMQGTTR